MKTLFSVLFMLLLLVACGTAPESATESMKPEVALPQQQKALLRLRAGASPTKIGPGDTPLIDVLVTTAQGIPVGGANVEVAAGGGLFPATGKPLIVGPTDQQGQFRMQWQAPDPALSGYQLRFLARIEGEAEGRTELTLLIE